jgi:multidrug efflux pump subunit AcrB
MQFTLPPGYRYDIGGEAAQRNTAVEHLFAPVGVLLVLMAAMLVLTCHSFRIAGILAGIGVLSVGLALAALWVSGYACGFTALVGIVGLVGIAIDEATVMLAALHHHPQARLGDSAAMHEVILGETQHLLSTSMTTIIGFVPLIVTGGGFGGFWPPLAIAIAGGVTGSTLLAVYFAPAAYLLLMRPGAIPAAIVGPVRGPKTLVPLLSCVCPTTRRPL